MKVVTYIGVVVFVIAAVEGPSGQVEKELDIVAQEARLLERYEEQLRLSALAEERRQEMVADQREIKTRNMRLEEEVLLLEAKAAEQQKMAREAPAEAAEDVRILRGHLQDGRSLVRDAAREADQASRRLCQALTEGHGDLQLLCRTASRDVSPDMEILYQYMEQQLLKEESNCWTQPLLLLLVGAAWLAGICYLLPRKKTLKTE